MQIDLLNTGALIFEWSVLELRKIRLSPSGKATGFGPVIRRFESCQPSQLYSLAPESLF